VFTWFFELTGTPRECSSFKTSTWPPLAACRKGVSPNWKKRNNQINHQSKWS